MLADRDGAGIEISGDSFLVTDVGVIGFLSSLVAFGRCVVNEHGEIRVEWLLDDIDVEPAERLTLDPLWWSTDSPSRAYSAYAEASGRFSNARDAVSSPLTWCSWYHYFDRVTPTDIRANLAIAAEHNFDVLQIDDGWQREIGEWGEVNERFGTPLVDLADEIQQHGMRAGIWTAPFCAVEGSELVQSRPQWFVTNDRGNLTTALFHEGWGGRVYALDTTQPDVLDHIESTYRRLREIGYSYFKIDFCHAGAAVGSRSRRDGTRASALRGGLEAIRRGIGAESYLLGCGSPLLSAVGVVDAMRVSEDVAPFYQPRRFFPGFEESSVATRNAIEQSCLRAPLHRRWFTLDPDCVMLRRSSTELSAPQRERLVETVHATGGLVAVSDDLSLYDSECWGDLDRLMSTREDGPRELSDPFGTPLEISWSTGSARIQWDEPM